MRPGGDIVLPGGYEARPGDDIVLLPGGYEAGDGAAAATFAQRPLISVITNTTTSRL